MTVPQNYRRIAAAFVTAPLAVIFIVSSLALYGAGHPVKATVLMGYAAIQGAVAVNGVVKGGN